jgi:selenocysteine lyase/cysteine desulfurase
MEMASLGMETMRAGGSRASVERLAMLTTRLADGLGGLPVDILDARVRAPHVLSLGFAHGMPASLVTDLAAENVYVAPRLGRLRISPHVYNDEGDIDRFVAVFGRLMRAA